MNRVVVRWLGIAALALFVNQFLAKHAVAGTPPATAPSSTQRIAATVPASRASTQPGVLFDRHAVIIKFLEDRVRRDPDDITALNRLAAEYLRRFRQSGDDHDLILSASTAAQSLHAVPAAQNSTALGARARALFALHGFAAARDLGRQLIDQEWDKRYPFEIYGDALLELGDYDAAADAYKRMEAFDDPDANTETRMARLALIRGDVEQARRRFESAVELARQVLPPAPDVVAWCLVQGGQLAFNSGDWEEAEKHYQAALESNPLDWTAIDHLGELRAAQKRYDESVSLYLSLVARVPRPELFQSLGDVYAIMGKPQDAALWHKKALDKYSAAAAAGSAHYYHHMAGFYSDTEPNPAEAVKWAKMDMEVRHSVYAYDGLAWALYKAGEIKPAAETMDKALAQGTKDAHLLYHASLIYYRAGDGKKARDCLLGAGQINPKFNEFHVHR
jgi:tetratricopeptide (TPR) repeat protein